MLSRVNRLFLSIFLTLVTLLLYTGCEGGEQISEDDIAKAIMGTQTAVALALQQQTSEAPLPTRGITSTPIPIGKHNLIDKDELGIRLSYDEAIIANISPEQFPLEQIWLPAHVRFHTSSLNPFSGNLSYIRFTFQEKISITSHPFSPYLLVYPLKDKEGNDLMMIKNDEAARKAWEGLSKMINEYNGVDKIFGDELEIARGFPWLETQKEKLAFQNGSGIRYITIFPSVSGPAEITNANLCYVFEGLTNGGQYYVELVYWLNANVLDSEKRLTNQDLQNFIQEPVAYGSYLSEIGWKLQIMLPTEYFPDLSILDAMVESLLVEPTLLAYLPTSQATSGYAISELGLGLGDPSWKMNFDEPPKYFFIGTDGYTETKLEGSQLVVASLQQIGDRWRLIELPAMGDIYMQMTAQSGPACSGKDGYGFIIRAPSTDAAYNSGIVFGVSCDGNYRLYRLDEGVYRPIQEWTSHPAIMAGPNQVNVIGILADGANISLYTNGTLLGRFTDEAYLMGQYGIMISSPSTYDYFIRVSDLAFWNLYQMRISTPTPTVTSSPN